MTSPFTAAQQTALRQLHDLWSPSQFVLIGASAIHCQRPMPRATRDLDVTLAVSMSDFPAGLDRLDGWRRHRTREHEADRPGGVRLDLLPAGPDLIAAGQIMWPDLEKFAPPDDDRRWEDDVIDAAVSFEEASSFLVGREWPDLRRRQIGTWCVPSRASCRATGTRP